MSHEEWVLMDPGDADTTMSLLVEAVQTAAEGFKVLAEAAGGYRKTLVDQGFSDMVADHFAGLMLQELQIRLMGSQNDDR